jgi:uncharacterized protein (DUF4415 family)
MTATELIRRYHIRLHGADQLAISGGAKLSKKVQEELRQAKPAILAELRRREQEQAETEARRQAEQKAEKQAILTGETPIRLRWHDGEYLSGHQVFGPAAELLTALGLAKPVQAWGTLVDHQAAKALGTEFLYAAAVEYARPAKEATAAKEAAKEAERQAKFAEARETGKPVLLRKWTTGCCDPKEECSLDIHYELAQPDGTVRREWHHTW